MKFHPPFITLATLAVALASYAVQVSVPRAPAPRQPAAICLGPLQTLFKEIGS